MLAEGWKEANIRMGLLRLGRGKGRTLSRREGQSTNFISTVPSPHPQNVQTQALEDLLGQEIGS